MEKGEGGVKFVEKSDGRVSEGVAFPKFFLWGGRRKEKWLSKPTRKWR